MIPRRIAGANSRFGAPDQWNAERDGVCATISARVDGRTVSTAWEPTPEELRILNEGGSIVLTVWGGQPPIRLSAEPQPAEEQI